MYMVLGQRLVSLWPSKRWTAWVVLFALLFIHVKVAVGGCLVTGTLSSPAVQAAQTDRQSDRGEPCSSLGTPEEQSCLKHCAQSVDTPKSTLDVPGFGQIPLPLPAALFPVTRSVSVAAVSTSPPTSPGPPAYLRFLRLLN